MAFKTGQDQAGTDYNKITEGVIWKQMLLFFFPLMFGTFFQMLYNTTDSIIVGQFVGTEALSAIGGAAAQIVNLTVGAFIGLSSGATVIISQYYGAWERDKVSKAVHTSMAMAILAGAVCTAAGILLADPMLLAMNTPADTMEESRVYLQVYCAGLIPNMVYNMGAGILRAVGDSKRPLYFLIVSCLANIGLDLLFVPVLGMGVFGAALATILCQALSAVLVLWSLVRSRECYGLLLREVRIDRVYLQKILRIGIPAMVQSLTYSISNVILQVVVNGFGTIYVAGWAACSKTDQVYWLTSQSFGIALTTFVGQNYGAGKKDRVRACMRQGFLIETVITLGLIGALWLAGPSIIGWFTRDEKVIDVSVMMIHFFLPSYVTYITVEVFSDMLRGLGDSVNPMIINISGICLFRVLWALIAVPRTGSFDTVMWSYPISWVITSALLGIYYAKRWGGRLKITPE